MFVHEEGLLVMSDVLFRIIPTDPQWQPTEAAAEAAVQQLRVFAPNADSVEVEADSHPSFYDPGEGFDGLCCPGCSAELDMKWWSDEMHHAYDNGRFTCLDVTTPCCRLATSLNDLAYNQPAGFACTAFVIRNPARDDLLDCELEGLETIVGHPLRRTIARY